MVSYSFAVSDSIMITGFGKGLFLNKKDFYLKSSINSSNFLYGIST